MSSPNMPLPSDQNPVGPTGPTVPWNERLATVPKPILYAILILVCALPQFLPIAFPNSPDESSKDLYRSLLEIQPGDKVLVATDWTNSTRGESRAEFIALFKVLIERGAKVTLYSTADPQAPQAALDTLTAMNSARRTAGKPEFVRGKDFVSTGFFANSEGATNGIANDLLATFKGKKDLGVPVLETPPMQGIKRVQDFKLLVVLTASKTSNIVVERVSGKVPLAFLVTGVMGPETQVFYQSKQIIGLSNGLKGAFDLEQLIAKGDPAANLPAVIPNDPPGQASKFYPTLHFAMALLVIMIVLGNIATIAGRSKQRGMR